MSHNEFSHPKIEAVGHGFYLLKDVKVNGPFKLNEIIEKIEKQELSIFDIVSEDKGETWKKIFQIQALLKNAGSKELPVTTNIDFKEDHSSHHSQNESQAIQSLAAVAHCSTPTQTNAKLKIDEIQLPQVTQQRLINKSSYAMLASFILCISFGVTFLFFKESNVNVVDNSFDETSSDFDKEVPFKKTNRTRKPASIAPGNVVQPSMKGYGDMSNIRRSIQIEPAYNPPIDEIRETHQEIAHEDMPQDEPKDEPVPEGLEPNISRGAASEAPSEDAIPVEEVGDF